MGGRGGVVKRVTFSIMLLCLITFSVMAYGSIKSSYAASDDYTGHLLETPSTFSYGIKNIFYYPSGYISNKVIPSVNGFYVVSSYFILFKSPNFQIPIRTTPVLYSDAFANGYNILANNTIYILSSGFYFNGGGGLSLWEMFINNGSLIDVSNILPSNWTVNGNNQFWLTGAYGNGTLALAEDNYNLTECNIVLIHNNVITKILTNPLGFTGTGQWASMAYADGKFLFLANNQGRTLAALIDQNGSVTNVSQYFNGISLVNPNSGLIGIDNIFIIAAGSTYVFDPSKLTLENVQNPVESAMICNFNSTDVMIAGVNSGNFTLELFNINTYNLTEIFSISSIPLLSNYGSLGAMGLGYFNGTILIAGPFLDQFGPISTTDLRHAMTGNVTFNIKPKDTWFTIDQCLCGRDMYQIALPLNNGTFHMDNAIYGEYVVYAQNPYYMDYYDVIDVNSSNQVINITLEKGVIETNNNYPWIPLGPHNITLQFLNYQIAQYSAHIGLFAIDSSDPNIMYAASSVGPGMSGPIGDGGIFKTVDGGRTWFPIDFGLPYGTVTGLYINESNPNELIAGIGKAGIYKTIDGGGYWNKVSSYGDAIDFSYSNGKLFAGSDQGIIESDNSGNSWQLIQPTNVEVNSISVSGNTIYALLNNLTLMKSTNLGINWTIIYYFNGYFPYTVRASPFNSSIVYVTIGASVSTFYSDDGGKTFSPVTALTAKTVVFDPLNRSVVWAVGYPDYYSFDGGSTFYQGFLSVDNMGIYVDPSNDSILLAGSDQGIYESNNKGISWYPINGNLIDELSDAITISQNGTRMLLSMQDLGTYMSYDQGESWFPVPAGPENALVFINPYNSSWVYSFDRGYSAPLRVSDNGGLTFFEVPNVYSPSYITGNKLFAVNSSNGKDVIIGTESGIYYSTNYGLNWSIVNNSPKDITAIQYISNNYIIVGTTNGIYVFNGTSWVASKGISGFVYSVSVDPGNNSIIAAAAGGMQASLYVSYDKGENFTEVNSGISDLFVGDNGYFLIPVQFFFLNVTGYPLIAITNYGIYLSTDLGKNWKDISYNLYSGQVDDLEFVNDTLFVATYGAGLEEIKGFSLQSLPGTINGYTNVNNLNITINGQPINTYEGHFRVFLKPGNYTLSYLLNGVAKNITINVKPMGTYNISINATPYQNYTITFAETGLPPGTQWSVTLNGTTKTSTNQTLVFNEPAGTYSYTVIPPTGYLASPSKGSVTVSTSNVTVAIAFSQQTYSVTFTETGLPPGTQWSVTFNGVTKTSTTSNITFTGVPAGNYTWNATSIIAMGNGTRYVAPTSSGTISVPATTSFNVSYVKQYIVTIESNAGGSTIPSGTSWYNAGSNVSITAIPASGYEFVGWETNSSIAFTNSSSAATNAIINSAGTIVATFKAIPSSPQPSSYTLEYIVAAVFIVIVILAAVLLIRRRK